MLELTSVSFILGALAFYFGCSKQSGNRKSLKRIIKVVILLLSLVCSLLPVLTPNYYTFVGINSAASQDEVTVGLKSFFRKLSSNADDDILVFAQNCAKTLGDPKMRKVYNAYGDLFENGTSQHVDELFFQSLTMSALWSVAMFVFAWILLSPSVLRFGRKILALWCVSAFCIEARTRVFQHSLTIQTLHLLPFEVALLLRSFITTLFVVAMILSDYLYINKDQLMKDQINNLIKVQAITIAHLQLLAKHAGVDIAPVLAGPEETETSEMRRRKRN